MAKRKSSTKNKYYWNTGERPTFQERNYKAKMERELWHFPDAGDGYYVYIVLASHFAMKIGIARDVKRRFLQLQNGNHVVLRLLGAYRIDCRDLAEQAEQAAHAALSDVHLQGEWFYVRPKIAKDAIEAFCRSRGIRHMWVDKHGRERKPEYRGKADKEAA